MSSYVTFIFSVFVQSYMQHYYSKSMSLCTTYYWHKHTLLIGGLFTETLRYQFYMKFFCANTSIRYVALDSVSSPSDQQISEIVQ